MQDNILNENSGWKKSQLQPLYPVSRVYDILPILFGILYGFSSQPYGFPIFAFICFIPGLYYFSLPIRLKRKWFWLSMGILIALGIQHYFFFHLLTFSVYAYIFLFFLFLGLYLQVIYVFLIILGLRTYLKLPFLLTMPFVWVLKEMIIDQGPFRFPWNLYDYSLTQSPFLLQFIDITGIYGVGFWLIIINLLATRIIIHRRNIRKLATGILSLLIIFAIPTLYNWYRWNQDSPGSSLRVGLVQSNVPQKEKWDPALRAPHMDNLITLTLKLLKYQPDVVIWPEGAYPWIIDQDNYVKYAPRLPAQLNNLPILMGAVTGCNPDSRGWCTTLWNSAYLYQGNLDMKRRYDKIVLVPVTEKIPFPTIFSFLKKFLPPVYGKTVQGQDHTVFQVKDTKFSVLICFESLFPELSRTSTLAGAQFLVNITNDAWFGETIGAYQHASFLSARAIENRRPVVRCAQSGISGFYDSKGRLYNPSRLNERTVVFGTITPGTKLTFYSKHGDILAYVSALACLVFLCLVMAKKWFGWNKVETWFYKIT